MKKILLSILMLLLTVTAAWAGEGNGSKEHPFTGEWSARDLYPKLEENKGKNMYLAYDCAILHGVITVTDTKLNNTVIANDAYEWSPRDILGSYDYSGYDKYCKYNSPDDRKSQMFVITGTENTVSTWYNIRLKGYFSGIYDYAGPALLSKKVDDVDYYVINSDEDYETFRQLVATGNPYANAILEADITVTKPIGSGDPQFHYRGTFDGQEHTITVNIDNKEDLPCGLFQYTEPGCVIRNMKVTGTLTSGHEYLGSIVGEAVGTRIEKCISDAKLKNTSSTLPVTGGLIGAGHGVNFIENCAFIGEIDAAEKACGIIGKVVNNVEIKSCYVDARFSNPEKSNQIMFKDDDEQIILNCYHFNHYDGTPTLNRSKQTNGTKLGWLCHELNVNGRSGIVWYQHFVKDEKGEIISGHPYPFKGKDGQPIWGIETEPLHRSEEDFDHTHRYNEGICYYCGTLDPNESLDPLQNVRVPLDNDGYITINNLKFRINKYKGMTTAELRGCANLNLIDEAVTAVHIPETIKVNGEVYTIDYVAPNAFKDSKIEYCYIPKTVKHVEKDAFDGCTNLSYLHIADCPSTADKLLLEHKGKDHALFADCSSLKKVYIGRDMKWKTEDWANPDEPFESVNSINDVFIGPRVSRVGNYYDADDPRDGWSYDLFNDVESIKRVYIMGDDQVHKDKKIEFWCVDGLGKASDYYINRDVRYTKYWEFSLTKKVNGCLDYCKHATYGPFVKTITERSFKGQAAHNNHYLETVDFTNAFRLETIENNAFNECTDLECVLDFSNTQLKVIENDAFYNVDKVISVNFGSYLERIGANAFNDSERITTISLPGTVKEVGDEAFGAMLGLSTVRLEDGDGHIEFKGGPAFRVTKIPKIDSRVSYIYQGRDYEYDGQPPFATCKKVTSVTIGPKVTKLNYNGYKEIDNFSITFLYSPNALSFQSTPAEVFYESKVRGMFIDRQLLDKNGAHIDWSEGSTDAEYSTKKNVENLSFGDHITAIPEHLFDHFSALKTVVIPASVTEIGKQAFIECGKLENLCILGDVHIGREAFARCTNLKHLFLMGQAAKVDELAFDGCNEIKEVITGFREVSEKLVGSAKAFTKDAYDNAHLVCAGDTKEQKIQFGFDPWRLFKSENRSNILTANDYNIEENDPKVEDYDHGYMPHSFTKDKYELVYAPFQMDSYYFGPKADIYKMELTDADGGMKFTDDYSAGSETKTYNIDDINFSKVDIDNEMLLSRGVYLVNKKTDKSLDNIASYHNLFNDKTVYVDNGSFAAQGSGTVTMSYSSDYPTPTVLTAAGGEDNTPYSFVCNEGVLKYVNGEYQPKVGEIVFTSPCEEGKHPVFNMMDGENNTILSSKIDIPFNAILDGYASFYAAKTANFNYIAPSWCDVYIVTSADGETVTLQKIEDRTINAGQAVLLKSNKEEKLANDLTEHLTFATNQSSASYTGNLLKGVEKDTEVSALGREFVYILSKTEGNSTGFYKYDKTLSAGKAYLDPEGLSEENLAKSCLFTFKDTTTGIKPMSESMSESVYDLMGRRLKEAGFKGVYIVNGKKVVVK